MKRMPKISIAMASFMRPSLLDLGLMSITKNKPEYKIEVVVVNDGLDDDGTKEVCDKYRNVLDIKYFFTGQRNTKDDVQSRSVVFPNNVAIRQSTGDIIILTNPEIYHLDGAIEAIIKPLLTDKKLLTIPIYMYFDNMGIVTQEIKDKKPISVLELLKHEEHAMMPFFLGCWKKELTDIGGYDEDMLGYAGDDNDLIDRLLRNGCRHHRCPAIVIHLYHGKRCVEGYQYDNPAWVYNRRIYESKRGQVIRNEGREWGTNQSKNMDLNIMQPIFMDIYENRKWKSAETRSGTGSELANTIALREQLPILFEKYGIRRVLDIGCGEVNWMNKLFPCFDFYLGLDVVPTMIELNREKYGTDKIQFLQDEIQNLDLNSYNFDAVVLNDVLVHLSFFDIKVMLDTLRKTNIKFIFATHFVNRTDNKNIPTGSWRELKMTLKPFSFVEPLEMIFNNDPYDLKLRGKADKTLSLWYLNDPSKFRELPKVCHLYWDGSAMSWLQTQTVVTFHTQNPDWKIKVYVSVHPFVVPNGKYVPDYTGKDYFYLVQKLPYVQIIPMDVTKYGIDKSLHNILQSDIFRYNTMYDEGGVWSDFDILWIRPISHIHNIKTVGWITTKEMGASICRYNTTDAHHNISVLMSQHHHPLYKKLLDETARIQKEHKDRNTLCHQEFGTDLLDKLYNTFEEELQQYPDVAGFPYNTFYPYSIFELERLYKETDLTVLTKDVIGVHWFNGHKLSKEYLNAGSAYEKECSMTKIVESLRKDLVPKISIVMAYYNRKQLLINTLRSIAKTAYPLYEVIVVDDNSVAGERVEYLQKEFPFLKVYRVEEKDKWYVNPCIPFNMGIAKADGEIVVLQNPECVHVHDVISYIAKHIDNETYLSISTYALHFQRMKEYGEVLANFDKQPQIQYIRDIGWYNHPKYRPVFYHFCGALTRRNMDALGGFDERYAMGVARDDVEFVDRITRLGLKKVIPTEVSVFHQGHSKVSQYDELTYPWLLKKNKILYELLTSNEDSVHKENSYK